MAKYIYTYSGGIYTYTYSDGTVVEIPVLPKKSLKQAITPQPMRGKQNDKENDQKTRTRSPRSDKR